MSCYCKTVGKLFFAFFIATCVGCGGRDLPFNYSKFVVFGANFSDTGNVYSNSDELIPGKSPNYFSGRWSNGSLWVENVAAAYGKKVEPNVKGGTNYAYGGAMSCEVVGVVSEFLDMCKQVEKYLADVNNKSESNVLFILDATAVTNEISHVLQNKISPEQVTKYAPVNITKQLELLYNSGARRFLVINVPDVGATPFAKKSGDIVINAAASLSNSFNNNLNYLIDGFASSHPNAHVYRADFNGIFIKLKSSPEKYALDNVVDSCLFNDIICAVPNSYLFWDDLYPTKAVGNVLSSYVLGLL